MKPTSDDFARGAQIDAAHIITRAQGFSLHEFRPRLWHAKYVPTYYGATLLADGYGLEIAEQRFETLSEWTVAFVRLKGQAMKWAGRSCDRVWAKEIAIGQAFRKSVEMALFAEMRATA